MSRLLLLGLLLLVACATPRSGQVEDDPTTPTQPVPAARMLADDAREQLAAGQPEAAAATLERAVRMAPEDPLLWHELARVHEAQQRWSQAEAMAQRSLSRGAREQLYTRNWELIARCRAAYGDAAGAAAARAKAAGES